MIIITKNKKQINKIPSSVFYKTIVLIVVYNQKSFIKVVYKRGIFSKVRFVYQEYISWKLKGLCQNTTLRYDLKQNSQTVKRSSLNPENFVRTIYMKYTCAQNMLKKSPFTGRLLHRSGVEREDIPSFDNDQVKGNIL